MVAVRHVEVAGVEPRRDSCTLAVARMPDEEGVRDDDSLVSEGVTLRACPLHDDVDAHARICAPQAVHAELSHVRNLSVDAVFEDFPSLKVRQDGAFSPQMSEAVRVKPVPCQGREGLVAHHCQGIFALDTRAGEA
eukprot:3664160-Rhodomonas_salina.2